MEDLYNIDLTALNKAADKAKSRVFLGKNAGFFGSLLTSHDWVWTQDHETAATDSITMWWNPQFFMGLPEETRPTIILHELWHPAKLHHIRQGMRHSLIWNWACDININNDLERQGYSFKGFSPWLDQKYGNAPEEDIYEDLWKIWGHRPENIVIPWGQKGDMLEVDEEQEHKIVNSVVTAQHQSKIAGDSGQLPGDIQLLIKQFLAPVVPWEKELMVWFTDLYKHKSSWKRPNRRYSDMYLPSRNADAEGRLDHLLYALDVSGSIQESDIIRFNSELKYIWEVLKPKKITVIQYDTIIQKVDVLEGQDKFFEVEIKGRGGTSLVCVREYIQKHKPTAAVIFTDLQCEPMQTLDIPIPIIWVGVRATGMSVPFGKLIHIKG